MFAIASLVALNVLVYIVDKDDREKSDESENINGNTI